MKSFSLLIKPASSLCNMNCSYCFYHEIAVNRTCKSYGIMTEDCMRTLIDKTLDAFSEEVQITFAFQGGEPTCATINYFYAFTQYVDIKKKTYHNIEYVIQTNGVMLNEEWCSLFQKYNFLVGISLDGYKENHDSCRRNLENCGNFEEVMHSIELLKQYNIRYNVLTVLTNALSYHAKELFAFYKKENMEYVQLIPCLTDLSNNNNEFSLTPKRFYAFYSAFFEEWYEEFKTGKAYSISLFDNIIPMFANIPPYQCGFLGFCSMQFVVESDGSIYPCDFYALDQYKIGNIKDNSIVELITSNLVKQFKEEPRLYCSECKDCAYYSMCYGQCKRMHQCYYDDSYCGYKQLLKEKENEFRRIARQIKKA